MPGTPPFALVQRSIWLAQLAAARGGPLDEQSALMHFELAEW